MDQLRIAVVTGSRAEFGLLYWVIHDMLRDPAFDVRLLVTGMHLSTEFGMTVLEIEQAYFPIAEKVEMLLASDSADGICKSMALGLIGLSGAIERQKPDALMLLGDRFEVFVAAQAALIHKVPVVHIAGGDTTEGAFDESIRHAITKMSHVHLVTHALSAQRVRQMGEDPRMIHVVGNPGLDHLQRRPLLDRIALESALGFPLGRRNALVTFHPVTLDSQDGRQQQSQLLEALESLGDDWTLWLTLPNADTGGRAMANELMTWASSRPRAHVFASLGQMRYLSLMSQVDVVVGNSSSGLYEAPSFKIPTVNVGDRQQGRLAASSVVHAAPTCASIVRALQEAQQLDCSSVVNPYGDGCSSAQILRVLRGLPRAATLGRKTFHLVGGHGV